MIAVYISEGVRKDGMWIDPPNTLHGVPKLQKVPGTFRHGQITRTL
jgi:hypothetical protein